MKKILFFIVLTALYVKAEEKKVLQREDAKFTYTATVNWEDSKDWVTIAEVIVRDKTTKEHIQTIAVSRNSHQSVDKEEFIVEDMNFDGFSDFRVLQYRPAFPNMPYYYYLYDPIQKKFVLQDDNMFWIELTSPEFDQKNKIIYSHMYDGTMGYERDTYKLIDTKWTIVESEGYYISHYSDSEEGEQTGYIRHNYRKELRQGKMILVEKLLEYSDMEGEPIVDSLFQLVDEKMKFIR